MNAVSSPASDSPSRRSRLIGLAIEPVDSLIVVWVRVAVAVAIFVWADAFLSDDRYRAIFVDARILMKYSGLEWIGLWPGDGMRWHFIVTKIAAVGLGIGLMTRLSAGVLVASVAYVLLVERQIYVNHYYLLSITAGLLMLVPSVSRWSVDALVGMERSRSTMPRWHLWLLRFQLGIPYVFGAVAKLNGDWFRGQPAELILRGNVDWFGRPWSMIPGAVETMVYGGFLYDLLVVPMLLWRPTRWIAVMMSLGFHLTNAQTLRIGVFPWFMLATLIVFFPPESLHRRWRIFWGRPFDDLLPRSSSVATPWNRLDRSTRCALIAAIAYAGVHVCLPIRPALYPGDANWNERGHRFAWRMMLRHKDALTHYLVVDQDRGEYLFLPSTTVLTAYQQRRADHHPELIRQTAVAIGDAAKQRGVQNCRVHALALVSLNGRRPKPIIDPAVDLTKVMPGWWTDDWVDDDPGPFLDPPWRVPKERWWIELDLPEPFTALQGKTPSELDDYLESIAKRLPPQSFKPSTGPVGP